MSETTALELRDVAVVYDDGTEAVHGIDLDVAESEIVALLGASGSGKSSLLRGIAGLERVPRGEVRMRGHDVATLSPERRDCGMVFQEPLLFPHRNVARNIAYGLETEHWQRAAIAERVTELLELVGLTGFGNRAITTLSGGQAQRVALARALAPKPALLLLDEPLSALDRALRERLAIDLRTILTATHTAGVFVTHDQDEAFAVADRVAIMDDGRLVQVGTRAELLAHPANDFVRTFLGARAEVTGRILAETVKGARVRVEGGDIDVAGLRGAVGDEVLLRVG